MWKYAILASRICILNFHNMKFICIFFFFLGFQSNILAQNINIIESTVEHWVGGACCSSGTNYIITLENSDTKQIVTIDTVWIGERFYTEHQTPKFSINKTNINGVVRQQILIMEGYTSDGITQRDISETPKRTIKPPKYKGKACIQYQIKNKKKLLSVKEFIPLQRAAMP